MSSRERSFPVSVDADSYVTRREFTKFLGLTSLAFLLGTFAATGRKLWKNARPARAASLPVAGAGEIPVGGYRLFRYPTGNDPCILLRLAPAQFVAFDQRCPHLSCPVTFVAASNRLACPCHKAFFNAEDGSVLAGPPNRGLERLEVSVKDGQVWVCNNA